MFRVRQSFPHTGNIDFQWHSTLRRRLPSRLFTKDAQSLLGSRSDIRPQLPYLHYRRTELYKRSVFGAQIGRQISTDKRQYYTRQVKYWAWILSLGIAFYTSLQVLLLGLKLAALEQRFPAPASWSYWTQAWYRLARDSEDPLKRGYSQETVGRWYKWALDRLEDPSKDGAGVKSIIGEAEEIHFEGVGKTGQDISGQPEDWRRGYFEVLMGSARAAEQLDDWVIDKKKNAAVPKHKATAPPHPSPDPIVDEHIKSPQEEYFVERAYEPPEVFYTKILTTRGFSSRQKLDAALAYADWLHFSGASGAAGDMYAWALDIATAYIPPGSAPPINKRTTIISHKASTPITPNILLAAGAIATHYARNGDLADALPIFLSVLRAQQSLPPADPSIFSTTKHIIDISTGSGLLDALSNLLEYDPEPPTGDEPATRTPASVCAEAGVMAHIGEIVFASSPRMSLAQAQRDDATAQQAQGLSWARDAVQLAESTLESLPSVGTRKKPPFLPPELGGLARGVWERSLRQGSPAEEEAKERCTECLKESTQLWKKMLINIDKEIETLKRADQETASTEKASGWREWLWGGRQEQETAEQRVAQMLGQSEPSKWRLEELQVNKRQDEIRRLLQREGISFSF